MADGTIIQGSYRLVRYTSEEPKCDAWTYAIEVRHGNSYIARYYWRSALTKNESGIADR